MISGAGSRFVVSIEVGNDKRRQHREVPIQPKNLAGGTDSLGRRLFQYDRLV